MGYIVQGAKGEGCCEIRLTRQTVVMHGLSGVAYFRVSTLTVHSHVVATLRLNEPVS